MHEINLDIIRVTEEAAIAASQWVGSGDKLAADKAATDAMRKRLNEVAFRGKIMIGEGKKDHSYGLFHGEFVGLQRDLQDVAIYELAVDPIDGTRPTVQAGPEAVSVLAIAGPSCLYTTEAHYVNKLAWGPRVAEKVKLDIREPIETTVEKVSKALGKPIPKITVCVLDRPRHEPLIKDLRNAGVRIKLIQDCDVSGAIATCLDESGIDLLCGAGGAPEAVIAACAMKCLRGGFHVQLCDNQGQVTDPKLIEIEDLVKGPCAFAATGVTNGSLLGGVRYTDRGPITHSVFMRSVSGTIRWLTTQHDA